MDRTTHKVRLAQWSKLIQECRQSGLSIRSWCQKHDVSEKKFYYWQRRLRTDAYQASQQEQQLPSVTFAALSVPSFNREVYQGFDTAAILHSGNVTVELSNTASESLLLAIRQVLTYAK